jgi:hypothetical protein
MPLRADPYDGNRVDMTVGPEWDRQNEKGCISFDAVGVNYVGGSGGKVCAPANIGWPQRGGFNEFQGRGAYMYSVNLPSLYKSVVDPRN